MTEHSKPELVKVKTDRYSFGPYRGRALFCTRSTSSWLFCPYSRTLISHTFFMMEASQPTTSGFFSLDIFKLLQTAWLQWKKKKNYDIYMHSMYVHIVFFLDASNICNILKPVAVAMLYLAMVMICDLCRDAADSSAPICRCVSN